MRPVKKDAYEDLTDSMAQQRASTRAVASSLKELPAVENKSALQKGLIQRKVAQLNEAVPELNLAYDQEKDALIGLTGAELDTRSEAQEEFEAQVPRLGELTNEQAEIEARLALIDAQESGAGNTRELQINIEALTVAEEQKWMCKKAPRQSAKTTSGDVCLRLSGKRRAQRPAGDHLRGPGQMLPWLVPQRPRNGNSLLDRLGRRFIV